MDEEAERLLEECLKAKNWWEAYDSRTAYHDYLWTHRDIKPVGVLWNDIPTWTAICGAPIATGWSKAEQTTDRKRGESILLACEYDLSFGDLLVWQAQIDQAQNIYDPAKTAEIKS